MPDIKEKPRMGKPKAKSRTSSLPRQAARMMKEKYIRDLKQRPEPEGSEDGYAAEQVENAGQWAVETLADSALSRYPKKQGTREATSERPSATEHGARRNVSGADAVQPRRKTENPLKERGMVEQAGAYQDFGAPIQKAGGSFQQGQKTQIESAAWGHAPQASKWAGSDSAYPQAESKRTAARSAGQSGRHYGPASRFAIESETPQVLNSHRGKHSAKERTVSLPKVHADAKSGPKTGPAPQKAHSPAVKLTGRKARQQPQRQFTQRMTAKAAQATKMTADTAKRMVAAAGKAAAELVSVVAGIAGGAVLLVAIVIVIVIAAVANSPFGLFFAQEPNGPDTVSVSQAVAQVNINLNARLASLQAGEYNSIIMEGHPPDWAEVLAVFSAKIAGAENGAAVAVLDPDRLADLNAVFWDMVTITATTEEVEHPASGDTPAWTEKLLTIMITPKTADDMRAAYAFTDYQNSALDELLADRAAMSTLAGDLSITDMDAKTLLSALPADLDPERRAVVETACQLVGKVNYFWGGKSLVIGWDSRWGQLQKVSAAGSPTTGTYRPYGLDCSGFVDWVFYNMTGGAYVIGHGGGARMQHTYCTDISWDEAQPGDLVFYPDDEHVGIVGGRDASGNLLVIHCASGANNVVITRTSGFTSIARPQYYT